ncbi:MAG: hypothetical protein JO076_00925, partial [Verrucomicrobia bacterium]|nr:hypothetical protein [Verrucomicrobiota bacterium]
MLAVNAKTDLLSFLVLMKAYQIEKFGTPDGLKLVDLPIPEPAPDEILVRIKAASINYRDLVVLSGEYDKNSRQGLIPLS